MILAHNCAVLDLPVDTGRLLGEPWGNYHLGLSLVCDTLHEARQQEEQRARAEMRKAS